MGIVSDSVYLLGSSKSAESPVEVKVPGEALSVEAQVSPELGMQPLEPGREAQR